jgi:hypothetical protein
LFWAPPEKQSGPGVLCWAPPEKPGRAGVLFWAPPEKPGRASVLFLALPRARAGPGARESPGPVGGAAIAPLPSNCVWIDLVFSQIKNAHNFNESEESLDHKFCASSMIYTETATSAGKSCMDTNTRVGFQSTYTWPHR